MDTYFSIDWSELFVPSGSLAEIVLRGTLMYFALIVLMRFGLKREPGGVGLADMLLVVILADASQNAMAGGYTSLTEGVILVSTLIFWTYACDWLSYRYPIIQHLLEPAPLMLIRDGHMLRRNMRKEMITVDELHAQLREHGVENIADVKNAWIESDGNVSVVKK